MTAERKEPESGQNAQEEKFAVKIPVSAKPERAMKGWKEKHRVVTQTVFYFPSENKIVFLVS